MNTRKQSSGRSSTLPSRRRNANGRFRQPAEPAVSTQSAEPAAQALKPTSQTAATKTPQSFVPKTLPQSHRAGWKSKSHQALRDPYNCRGRFRRSRSPPRSQSRDRSQSHDQSRSQSRSHNRSLDRRPRSRPQDRHQSRRSRIRCFLCKRSGHIVKDCPDIRELRELYKQQKSWNVQAIEKPAGIAGHAYYLDAEGDDVGYLGYTL